jgi:hypothetical protein
VRGQTRFASHRQRWEAYRAKEETHEQELPGTP